MEPTQSDNTSQDIEEKEKYSILIVEDDNVLRNMYTRKLESDGYRVVGASDGEDAFEIFKKENIDLIITDIMLPRVSGNEFLKKVKATEKGKGIPVIAWSNLMYEEEKRRALELGASEYIVKGSLTLEKMSETVRKYLK